ncbi:hypothetical protein ABEX73_13660 [Bacillus anthracis]|uniref:hypothetical protein n=1 Tax=Bacillus anthracis TaxID=1392 RepID=UPI003D1E56B3
MPIALELFNEAEKESDSDLPNQPVETITYRRKKKRGHGDESVQNLPVEIAKKNNLSSYHYLRYLFEALSNNDLNNKEEIDKVLPWAMDLPTRCIGPKKSEVNKVSLRKKINICTSIISLIIIKMKAFVIYGGITSNE